jgi:branched-chain amino acid transport system substrate-binding protein
MKPGILAGASLAAILTGAAFAQGVPIKLADVAERSGGGATVGTNWLFATRHSPFSSR